MPTRFNAESGTRFGVSGVPSGYDRVAKEPSLTIPAVGLTDADAALFALFDKEIKFTVADSVSNKQEMKRVPVIFASSEKWALAKAKKGVRDSNGSLILPLVTIVRTNVSQDLSGDIAGRGINQQTGEIVIRRKVDASDRNYQGWINRLLIKHQQNVAVSDSEVDDGQVSTTRAIGDLASDPDVIDGALLTPDRRNNVYETLVVPSPQFYTANYDITFRTQYVTQMNQLVETLIASFLPQGNAWRLDTGKGYWFMAKVDGNVYNAENNFEDMSAEERLIQYKFTVNVKGYIFATQAPGAPVPLKRYISCPTITFDVGLDPTETVGSGEIDDPYLGADDPTLPTEIKKNGRRDQRAVGATRLYPNVDVSPEEDPARSSLPRGRPVQKYRQVVTVDSSGNKVTKNVRASTTNRYTGETVYSQEFDLGTLTTVID